jgi:hypothetical protein
MERLQAEAAHERRPFSSHVVYLLEKLENAAVRAGLDAA